MKPLTRPLVLALACSLLLLGGCRNKPEPSKPIVAAAVQSAA